MLDCILLLKMDALRKLQLFLCPKVRKVHQNLSELLALVRTAKNVAELKFEEVSVSAGKEVS